MFESSAGATRSHSDADILNAIRSGDPVAYGLLRRRHMPAARRLAQFLLSGSAAAEDAVDQAFENVLATVQRGGGPTDAFRPYLLSAVREATATMPGQPAGDTAGNGQPGPTQPGGPRPDLVVAAFMSLPERWRAVLWHVCAEGESPAEAGVLLGLPEPDAAELASQAREALSLAYHRRMEPGAKNNMTDVDGAMRTAVAPAILGHATGAYLTRPVASPPPPGRAGANSAAGAGPANGAGRGKGAASANADGAGPAKKASKRRTAAKPSGRRRAAAPEAAGLGAAGAAAGPGTGPGGGVPGPSEAGQAGPGPLPRTAWTELPGAATPAAAADPASLTGLPATSGWGPVPVDRRTVWTGAPIANAPGVPGAPAPSHGSPGPGAPGRNAAGHGSPGYGTPGSDPLGQTAPGPSAASGPGANSWTTGPATPGGPGLPTRHGAAAGPGAAAGAPATAGSGAADGPNANPWTTGPAAPGGPGLPTRPGAAAGPGAAGVTAATAGQTAALLPRVLAGLRGEGTAALAGPGMAAGAGAASGVAAPGRPGAAAGPGVAGAGAVAAGAGTTGWSAASAGSGAPGTATHSGVASGPGAAGPEADADEAVPVWRVKPTHRDRGKRKAKAAAAAAAGAGAVAASAATKAGAPVLDAAGTGSSTKEFPAVTAGAVSAGSGKADASKGAAGKAGASAAGAGGSGGRDGQVGGGLAGAWRRSSPPQRKLVAGAAVLMVAAAVAIAVVSLWPGGTSGGGSQSSASAGTRTAGGGAPAGQPSPAPAPSGGHKARHHKPARHHPAKQPKASPSPSPTPKKPPHPHPGPHGIARLTAGVSVSGPTRSSRDARVTYAASNIGNIATKSLSSSITLPAGAVLAPDWERNGSSGGWDCHSGGHHVVCRHGSVRKDNQAVGSFSIVVRSRTACGQPVTFTVDGGTPRTRAQSSALIQCSNVRFGALDLSAQSTPASGQQLTARLARPLAV